MRFIVFVSLVALGGACDRGEGSAPEVPITSECNPMPVVCPERLACEVTAVESNGQEVRMCSGTSCCQSFCEQNGCTRCCATTAPPLP